MVTFLARRTPSDREACTVSRSGDIDSTSLLRDVLFRRAPPSHPAMITLLAIPAAFIVSTMASAIAPRPVNGEGVSYIRTRTSETLDPSVAMLDTALESADPNARCVMRRGAWSAIAFSPVNLGPEVVRSRVEDVIHGPHTRVVVTDSAQWPAVWRAATDPSFSPDTIRLRDGRDSAVARAVLTPAIRFGGDAIVFVTTRTHNTSPTTLGITSIRRCRRTGVVVVRVLETRARPGAPIPSRAFAAVRLRRQAVERAPVVFVDRARLVAVVTDK